MDPMPAHPLFAPGAPAVRVQVAFEALRTVAVGVVMLCLGRILAGALDGTGAVDVAVVVTAAAAVLVAAAGEAASHAVDVSVSIRAVDTHDQPAPQVRRARLDPFAR